MHLPLIIKIQLIQYVWQRYKFNIKLLLNSQPWTPILLKGGGGEFFDFPHTLLLLLLFDSRHTIRQMLLKCHSRNLHLYNVHRAINIWFKFRFLPWKLLLLRRETSQLGVFCTHIHTKTTTTTTKLFKRQKKNAGYYFSLKVKKCASCNRQI